MFLLFVFDDSNNLKSSKKSIHLWILGAIWMTCQTSVQNIYVIFVLIQIENMNEHWLNCERVMQKYEKDV